MHRTALTISQRENVFQPSKCLLKRHDGYVPFSCVLGYTAYQMDGRDRRVRFLGEWLAAPLGVLRHRA